MNCKQAQGLLPLYVDNDLEVNDLKTLTGHLEGCAECRRRAELDRELTGSLARLRAQPPKRMPALRGRVMGKVESYRRSMPLRRAARLSAGGLAGLGVVAAIAVVVLALVTNSGSTQVGQNGTPSTTITPTAGKTAVAAVTAEPTGGVSPVPTPVTTPTATSAPVWQQVGLAGKQISLVATHSIDPSILFAGSRGEGLFRSTDGGSTWQPVNEGLQTKFVNAVVVDSTDPQRVFAGTGESAAKGDPGAGVYRSTDGGDTWSKVQEMHANSIVIDPTDPKHIYAAGAPAIMESKDGGDTWQPAYDQADDMANYTMTSLAFSPSEPGTLLMGGVSEGGSGIVLRRMAAGPWEQVLGPDISFVTAVVYASPSGKLAYAATGDGIWKSTDGGSTWQTASTDLQGAGVSALAADMSGKGILYAALDTNGVYWTRDAGQTWHSVQSRIDQVQVKSLALRPGKDVLYAATADGIWSRPAVSATSDFPAQPTVAPGPSSQADIDAAVQTLLDYYIAINNGQYQQAYGYWSGNGKASNQTLDEFTQGFADTVRVGAQFGMPAEQGTGSERSVTVPITLTSVVNQSTAEQAVKHYEGTYTLQPEASAATETTGWVIAGASITEVAGTPQPPADLADPVALLKSYYDAINNKEFARAYTYWDNLGQASNQTFTRFREGFATTKHVSIEVETPQLGAAAGSAYAEVPVTITATQADGTTKTFSGAYTVRMSNVPPFDQLGWQIESATESVQAASAQQAAVPESPPTFNGTGDRSHITYRLSPLSRFLNQQEAEGRVRDFLGEPDAVFTGFSIDDSVPADGSNGTVVTTTSASRRYVLQREVSSAIGPDEFTVDAITGEVTDSTQPGNALPAAPRHPVTEAEAKTKATEFASTRFFGFNTLKLREEGQLGTTGSGDKEYVIRWQGRAPDSGAWLPTFVWVGVDLETGQVTSYTARRYDYTGQTEPAISEGRAAEIALAEAKKETSLSRVTIGKVQLEVDPLSSAEYKLVWIVRLEDLPAGATRNYIMVDALTGQVLNPVGAPVG